jgi:hypothetical protein
VAIGGRCPQRLGVLPPGSVVDEAAIGGLINTPFVSLGVGDVIGGLQGRV